MSGLQSQGVAVPQAQQMRFRKAPTGPVLRKTKVVNPADQGLLKDHNLRLVLPGWSPSLLVAFRMIILIRFFSGMYTGIADCDEGALRLSLARRRGVWSGNVLEGYTEDEIR